MKKAGWLVIGGVAAVVLAFSAGRSSGGSTTLDPASDTQPTSSTVVVTSTVPYPVPVPDPQLQNRLDQATQAAQDAQESADAALEASQEACRKAQSDGAFRAVELDNAARALREQADQLDMQRLNSSSGSGSSSIYGLGPSSIELRSQASALDSQANELRFITC